MVAILIMVFIRVVVVMMSMVVMLVSKGSDSGDGGDDGEVDGDGGDDGEDDDGDGGDGDDDNGDGGESIHAIHPWACNSSGWRHWLARGGWCRRQQSFYCNIRYRSQPAIHPVYISSTYTFSLQNSQNCFTQLLILSVLTVLYFLVSSSFVVSGFKSSVSNFQLS